MSKFHFYYKYPWFFIGGLLMVGLYMVYLGSETMASARRLASDPGHVTAEIVAKEYRSGRSVSKPARSSTAMFPRI